MGQKEDINAFYFLLYQYLIIQKIENLMNKKNFSPKGFSIIFLFNPIIEQIIKTTIIMAK